MPAPIFFRFSELNSDNIHREFQTHTKWTDGNASVAEILAAAEQRGIRELAFTEHARATSDYFPTFFEEIDAAGQRHPRLRVFKGFEVKILDETGSLDIHPDMRAAADIVIASVHSFSDGKGGRKAANAFDREEAEGIEFRMAIACIEQRKADVMSHAAGMSLRHFGTFSLRKFEDLLRACAKYTMPFEINYAYHRDVLDDLLPLIKKIDPPISIGSDVHELGMVGACRDALAQRLCL